MKSNCSLKKLSVLFFILCILIIFCCCSDRESDPGDPLLVEQEEQTRIRNLLNGGDIVQDGRYAYYTLRDTKTKPSFSYLYRVEWNTSEQIELAKLNHPDIDNLNVDQDWIYYVAKTGAERVSICRMSKTGEDLKCLAEGRVCGVYPKEEELYYINSDHCVSKVNLNTGRKELVTDEIANDLIFFGDDLYVFSGDHVYATTDSGERKEFLPDRISIKPETLCVRNDSMYFINLSNPRGIVCYEGADGAWRRIARLPEEDDAVNYEFSGEIKSSNAPDRLYMIGGTLYMNQTKEGRYGPFKLIN